MIVRGRPAGSGQKLPVNGTMCEMLLLQLSCGNINKIFLIFEIWPNCPPFARFYCQYGLCTFGKAESGTHSVDECNRALVRFLFTVFTS